MAVVMALRPVAFRWLESGSDDVGFIAQEVETVLPDIVTSRVDGYKSVNYPRIGVHVVKALQEMKAAVDKRFEEIESRLSGMEHPQNATQEPIEGLADVISGSRRPNSNGGERQEQMHASTVGNLESGGGEYKQRQSSMEAQIRSMKKEIEELKRQLAALVRGGTFQQVRQH